jgi:hypothetical protein
MLKTSFAPASAVDAGSGSLALLALDSSKTRFGTVAFSKMHTTGATTAWRFFTLNA